MSIYITGDTHGEYGRLCEIDREMKKGDYVIVCGDFGYVSEDYSKRMLLNDMEAREYTYLFVDGNHENFDALYDYPVEEWNGGKIHRVRKNIIHLCRGQVFNIEGMSFFTMGGGYSIDQYMRKEGVSWWPQEMPTEEEYEEAKRNLERAGRRVDYILTHTACLSALELLGKTHGIEEYPLNDFLEEHVRKKVEYKRWYFGHLHIEREINLIRQTALYNKMVKL